MTDTQSQTEQRAGTIELLAKPVHLWERAGRKRLFEDADSLYAACCGYFEWCHDNPLIDMRLVSYKGESVLEPVPKLRAMTLAGLCLYLGINITCWSNWRSELNGPFVAVCEQVEAIIREQKFAGAAADLLNPSIIARDLGLADKVQHGGSVRHDHQAITEQTTPDEAARIYREMIEG